MPNLTAYLALFAWPLVGVILFRTQPPERALVWTILGGYLFLPVRPVIDFPMIPAIDKGVIASVVALVGAMIVGRGWVVAQSGPLRGEGPAGRGVVVHSRFPRLPAEGIAPVGRTGKPAAIGTASAPEAARRLMSGRWVLALCLMAATGTIGTTLTNAEPVPAGPYLLPGMRVYDLVSILLGLGLMLVPFLLGWRYLGSRKGQQAVLVAFAVGGLLYAPLMLIEVRLSPQLNTWIYGFFPHSFAQHVRGGGFRPIVFLPHGLWVGIFMTMAILSSLALWRLAPTGMRPIHRLRWLVLGGGLLVVLVLAKSLGALVIALCLGPLVLFGGRRLVLWSAASVAALVLIYPMARGAGLVPVEAVLSVAESIDADRAESLRFRLDNEDILLERANEKALFGWGSWGRGLIFDDRGNQVSVSDGEWVIRMSNFGWVGYLASFALMCLPMIRLAFGREGAPEAAFLAAVLAANLLDLIPNATLEPITWLLAGALAGSVLPDSVPQTTRLTRRSGHGAGLPPMEAGAMRGVNRARADR